MAGLAAITLHYPLSGRRETLTEPVSSCRELYRLAPKGARFFQNEQEICTERCFRKAMQLSSDGIVTAELDVIIDSRSDVVEEIARRLRNPEPQLRAEAMQFIVEQLPEFWSDRLCVMRAITVDALLLQHVEGHLRQDPDIVTLAVQHDSAALQFASDAAKDDETLVLSAVTSLKEAPRGFRYASERLRSNRSFIGRAVKENAAILFYASAELQADSELALLAAGSMFGWLYFVESPSCTHCANVDIATAALQSMDTHFKSWFSKIAVRKLEPCYSDTYEAGVERYYQKLYSDYLNRIITKLDSMQPHNKHTLVQAAFAQAQRMKLVSFHAPQPPCDKIQSRQVDAETWTTTLAGPEPPVRTLEEILHLRGVQMPVILEVAEPWFTALHDGCKRVEGRQGTSEWAALQPGNELIVRAAGASPLPDLRMRLVATRQYSTVREYLCAEGLAATLPGVDSLEAGEAVYDGFWSAEDVARYGVVALEVKRI